MSKCKACDLFAGCNTPCIGGTGDPKKAKMMIITDAPTFRDDQVGRLFSGSAGKLLSFILFNKLSVAPLDVYITSTIKCRPPKGNLPSKKAELDELIDNCFPVLEKEIDAVNPKVIVLLGGTALSLVNQRFITKHEGMEVPTLYEGARTFAAFSPAYVLRSPSKESNLARALHKACKTAKIKVKCKKMQQSGVFDYGEERVVML